MPIKKPAFNRLLKSKKDAMPTQVRIADLCFLIVDPYYFFEVTFILIFSISLFISPNKSLLFVGQFLSALKRHSRPSILSPVRRARR